MYWSFLQIIRYEKPLSLNLSKAPARALLSPKVFLSQTREKLLTAVKMILTIYSF